MSGIDLFLKGGPVMWILLVCSIICVSVGFERSRVYGKNKIKDLEKLKKEIKKCLALKELEEAKRCCQQNQSFILSVALSGLQALEDQENVDTTLESVATGKITELKKGLNYLSSIVTLAPLLGLLGTVIGMIQSFSIFNLQAGKPLAITEGIGEALIATATGLIVAIIALILYLVLARQANLLITKIEEICAFISIQAEKYKRNSCDERRPASEV